MAVPLEAEHLFPVIAAVDVGTNSIKMTVARRCPGQDLEVLDSASETVRLGEGVAATGQLAPDRIAAALATLASFAERARSHGDAHLVGVATEATRRAANGEEFLARVREETGWNLAVVSGDEEAALTFRGLAEAQDLSGVILAADIGGGSTELILAKDGEVRSAESIALGSGMLSERLVDGDPPAAEEIDAVRAAASAQLAARADRNLRPDRLFVLGGTAEHLARLVPDPDDIAEADISAALARVSGSPAAELALELDIPEARARVLPAGIAIISALVDLVQPVKVAVAQSGIRTGLILATLAEIDASAPAAEARAGREPKHPRDAMRLKLASLWENVWNAMPAAIAGEDPEGVHAVRVASRRLRAGMATASRYFPRKWYQRLHETARDITGDLGAVRDRDVLLEALEDIRSSRLSSQERMALDHLIARVRGERDAARRTLLEFAADLDARQVRAETERRFTAPVAKSPSSPAKEKSRRKSSNSRKRRATRAQLAADARHALKPRIGELFDFDAAIRDPDQVRKHHRARIAAKRLRYTLELFADQFGEAGDHAIQEMKDLQEELGLIHDIDVRIALIDDEVQRLARASEVEPRLAAGFAKLRDRQAKLRGEHHAALVDRWTRIEQSGFRKDLRWLTRTPSRS